MNNNFNFDDLRAYYEENEICRYCGKPGANTFHHVFGRGNKGSKAESSILNATPLHNSTCHINIHAKLMTRKQQLSFLKMNLEHLIKQGYDIKKVENEPFWGKYGHMLEDLL